MSNRTILGKEFSAIAKAVGCHVENSHHERALAIRQRTSSDSPLACCHQRKSKWLRAKWQAKESRIRRPTNPPVLVVFRPASGASVMLMAGTRLTAFKRLC